MDTPLSYTTIFSIRSTRKVRGMQQPSGSPTEEISRTKIPRSMLMDGKMTGIMMKTCLTVRIW